MTSWENTWTSSTWLYKYVRQYVSSWCPHSCLQLLQLQHFVASMACIIVDPEVIWNQGEPPWSPSTDRCHTAPAVERPRIDKRLQRSSSPRWKIRGKDMVVTWESPDCTRFFNTIPSQLVPYPYMYTICNMCAKFTFSEATCILMGASLHHFHRWNSCQNQPYAASNAALNITNTSLFPVCSTSIPEFCLPSGSSPETTHIPSDPGDIGRRTERLSFGHLKPGQLRNGQGLIAFHGKHDHSVAA